MNVVDSLQIIGHFLSDIWSVFDSLEVPFIAGLSFADMAIGFLFITLSIRLLRHILNSSSGGEK